MSCLNFEFLVLRKAWTNENSRIETCLSLSPFPVSQPMRKLNTWEIFQEVVSETNKFRI